MSGWRSGRPTGETGRAGSDSQIAFPAASVRRAREWPATHCLALDDEEAVKVHTELQVRPAFPRQAHIQPSRVTFGRQRREGDGSEAMAVLESRPRTDSTRLHGARRRPKRSRAIQEQHLDSGSSLTPHASRLTPQEQSRAERASSLDFRHDPTPTRGDGVTGRQTVCLKADATAETGTVRWPSSVKVQDCSLVARELQNCRRLVARELQGFKVWWTGGQREGNSRRQRWWSNPSVNACGAIQGHQRWVSSNSRLSTLSSEQWQAVRTHGLTVQSVHKPANCVIDVEFSNSRISEFRQSSLSRCHVYSWSVRELSQSRNLFIRPMSPLPHHQPVVTAKNARLEPRDDR